jgi:hypothetical protein
MPPLPPSATMACSGTALLLLCCVKDYIFGCSETLLKKKILKPNLIFVLEYDIRMSESVIFCNTAGNRAVFKCY